MNIKDIRRLAIEILNNIPDGEEVNISDVRDVVRRQVFSEGGNEDDSKAVYNIVYSCISPVIITEGLKRVEVTNFPTAKEYPIDLKVNNLSELVEKIEELKKAINDIQVSPQVNVSSPEVKVEVPTVNIPDININLDGVIESLKNIRENAVDNPLSVRLSDGDSWVKELKEQRAQTTQYMSDVSYSKNAAGMTINPATEEGQAFMLVPKAYDYIYMSPAAQPTTVIYKIGGSGGTTVATLTITYSGTDIESVTRT